MKAKGSYYAISESRIWRPFLRRRLPALVVHWVFQGMLYTDTTELIFRLAIDGFLTSVFALVLSTRLPLLPAIAVGLLLAHTLSFLFNGQIFVVLKHFGDVKHHRREIDEYISSMRSRLEAEPSVCWAAVYGSLSRGEMTETSDLDVRAIRHRGMLNGIRACAFVLTERTRAHLSRFPLDILLLDSPRLLKQMRTDEPAVVIYDESGETFQAYGGGG
jgi:hypothetical protein